MESRDDESTAREVTAASVGQTLAAGAGLAVGGALGGPAGAVTGAAAAPYAAWAARAITERYLPRRNESPVRLLTRTAERLGVDPRALDEMARGTDARLELAGEAIWAAWHTLNEQKIDALSVALSNGLSHDDARVDEERLVIAALAELETPHVKVLSYMAEPDPRATALGRSRGRIRSPVTLDQVVREVPGFSSDIAGAVMATLERTHCVDQEPVDVNRHMVERERQVKARGPVVGAVFPAKFDLTAFGERCLRYLEGRGQSG